MNDITNHFQRAGVTVFQSSIRRRLREQQYRGYTTRCKQLISSKKQKAILQFAKKYRDEPHMFWNKVLWTDETKTNQTKIKTNHGICYQILSGTYFHTLCSNNFAPPKSWWSDTKGCYLLSSLTHLGLNMRK